MDRMQRTHLPEAPWWIVNAIDKKKAGLNCIHHLLGQVPYVEVHSEPVMLPEPEHHAGFQASPLPQELVIPEVY